MFTNKQTPKCYNLPRVNSANVIMNPSVPSSNADNATPKEKQKAGSRLAVASAFAFIGQELKWVGTAMDVKASIGHESGGLWGAFRKVFNVKETQEAAKNLVTSGEAAGHFSATLKVIGRNLGNLASANKWHFILAAAGAVAAGTVGWFRGGLLDDAGDLVHHPIRSLKIIAGIEAPPTAPKQAKEPVAAAQPVAPTTPTEQSAPESQAATPTPATTIKASSIQHESTLQQSANQQSSMAV